ncbi:efflux transporter outer membrane subunit [Desulfopila aestuarii]|uniref:Efflux transporter, outer membrane factor (OMF) lipoprotein, NodT family n=1 Tax=Desulfopila aestuarii DSM 18488 TaxID=1121416 RepID=A0A1M7XXA6_9BACT|nr:efflux transporter outer membrane subunit [Desulfopila aestuarii]SHO43537.1 efflux transporter, outer membrane factor (OMF) lipoprotein, NodT family [Desulfopila aestuarii DSM 18488]
MPMRPTTLLSSCLALLLFGQGCAVAPDYSPPDLSPFMQDNWQTTVNNRYTPNQPDSRWWDQFNDSQLTALINQLFASNIALQASRERITEAMARQGVVSADKQLQLAAALGYTRAETGDETVTMQMIPPGKTVDIYSAGVVAGWELDLWGRTARLIEAAEADVQSAYSDHQAMLVSLAAEMTLAYVEMRSLEARTAIISENIGLQQKSLRLAQDLYLAGSTTGLAVARSERLLESTRARLPELERKIVRARNRIQVLLGKPPGFDVSQSGKLPDVPPLLGLGLPADLLTRRADIRQGLYLYQAAVARTAAAEAERYPTLTISGNLTLSSDSLSGVFDPDSLFYSLGPGLRLPLFTGGRIESNIAIRASQTEQARLALEQKIIEALAEVESSADGVIYSLQQVDRLKKAATAAKKSVTMSETLYQSGLVDFFQVLDNQQQLVANQEALELARHQALTDVIQLYRALGGGWEQATTVKNPESTTPNAPAQE